VSPSGQTVRAHADFTGLFAGVSANASLTYYVVAVGKPGASGSVTLDVFSDGVVSGSAGAALSINDTTVIAGCSGELCSNPAERRGGWLLDDQHPSTEDPSVPFKITISAQAAADSTLGVGDAFVDPYIVIDPSTPDASLWTLVFSDGIGNDPLPGMVGGSVPEPSTWAMMLLGFAGLAFAGLRARGRFHLPAEPSAARSRPALPTPRSAPCGG
jgi:hypothetical protein